MKLIITKLAKLDLERDFVFPPFQLRFSLKKINRKNEIKRKEKIWDNFAQKLSLSKTKLKVLNEEVNF